MQMIIMAMMMTARATDRESMRTIPCRAEPSEILQPVGKDDTSKSSNDVVDERSVTVGSFRRSASCTAEEVGGQEFYIKNDISGFEVEGADDLLTGH